MALEDSAYKNRNIDLVYSFNMAHLNLDELETSLDGNGLIHLGRHF